MNTYTKESLIVVSIIALLSISAVIGLIRNNYVEANIIIPLYISFVAVLFSYSAIYTQGTRAHRQEEIRLIEKSLENFYRPLQNLFSGYEQNPIDCYQEQKIKFLEIGCYRHLSETRALLYFEKCPQDNESLKELIKQVMEDIDMLQKKYKEKSNNEGFFS
ncbi:hypothetical protein [Methanosarcina mazei]|uniref:hypothetical protein n=1 Tax=Methanosarcina mazei TaxID=2209 RepID=UPI001C32D4E2|nr:hypothetical protein [Methanosarcina mazei]BBL63969.1 hypothetical protein MmazTMA_09460 [Methanosarcina mazei]